MSVSNIDEKTRIILWGRAAGRCQYRGCNSLLYEDPLTRAQYNQSYIAHIIADKPGGPRGDPIQSPRLAKEIRNLMLLCDRHHRLIDKEDVQGHPVELLRSMKAEHESRISLQTNIQPERASEIILYSANIGTNVGYVNYQKAANAILKQGWYPSSGEGDVIHIGLRNNYATDDEEEFWKSERENLHRQIDLRIRPRLRDKGIAHLSIFAIAPMPLLIELGRMLSDIPAVEVYQLHREPVQNWLWQEHMADIDFQIVAPEQIHKILAIAISLSAHITPDRIKAVLGENVSIWHLCVENPHTSLIRSREQLGQFRVAWRNLLNQVAHNHGVNSVVNLFPAVPVSVAVEIGRLWQSKADTAMSLFDQNKRLGGFTRVFQIDNTSEEIS